ncbi:DUF3048 domain-containing protein [Pseudonocardiaceae bacterium YIM PH 21723]|nr:DUF3048 domain-containing protein [Pseudonocardiaceae bacterium YIM PH 21723]
MAIMRGLRLLPVVLTVTAALLTAPVAGGSEDQQILVMKIDNSKAARPQTGIAAADLMYVEPVEGGLSRLMAVYWTNTPQVVGPVRSARESDINLLQQFGRPALGFSGGAPEVLNALGQADISLVNKVAGGYVRHGDRPAPHNLYADPAKLLQAADANSHPPALARGSVRPDGVSTASFDTKVAATPITVTWDDTRSRWMIAMDGAPLLDTAGGQASAGTVIVQQVRITDSAVHDVAGVPSPIADTTGGGKATVLRDRMRFDGNWTWNADRRITEFSTDDREPIPLAESGPVWILLAKA